MYTSFGGSAKLQQTITGDEFLGYGFEDLHFFLLFWSGFLRYKRYLSTTAARTKGVLSLALHLDGVLPVAATVF
jgi:hypothetical protein